MKAYSLTFVAFILNTVTNVPVSLWDIHNQTGGISSK